MREVVYHDYVHRVPVIPDAKLAINSGEILHSLPVPVDMYKIPYFRERLDLGDPNPNPGRNLGKGISERQGDFPGGRYIGKGVYYG